MTRPPRFPARHEVLEAERDNYDAIVHWKKFNLPRSAFTENGEEVFDWTFADVISNYYTRLLANPDVPVLVRTLIEATQKRSVTQPIGTFNEYDHQLIDLVLCFDAEYWCLMRLHTPLAVRAGIKVETIEALRDGREDELDDDTRFVVTFVRSVAAGTMTDDVWNRMEQRLGSERGTYDLAVLILILQFQVRLHQVVAVEPIGKEEFDEMLDRLRNGTFELTPRGSAVPTMGS